MKLATSFDYVFGSVRQLQVTNSNRSRSGKLTIKEMLLHDQPVQPSARFWKSLFVRYGISDSVFRYFSPAEVFGRVADRASDELRFCIERPKGKCPRLLAVSNPQRPVIHHEEVVDLIQQHDAVEHEYADGLITSDHVPRLGDQAFTIRGDQFAHRFVMETPIDGFGHPKIYLSFLRQVCSNGMVAYGRAFRSDISLGKDMGHCISRALAGFDNGEGYAAMRQRFESAQHSWASVRECYELSKRLTQFSDGVSLRNDHWSRDFHRMTGNLNTIYGLANLNALSVKRQRILPTRCRVYDLMNFASEMATHYASTIARRTLQAFIGTMLADEYDLEGTADTVTEFTDFLVAADGHDVTNN